MMSKEKILAGIDEQIANKRYDITDTSMDMHLPEEWRASAVSRMRRQVARLREIRVELEELLL